MKKLSILFLFIPFVAMGQIWPTDVQYQFLNGIYAGNYGNLHITSDGDIDTIKGSAYDWPDSLRVVDAGKRYYLTGVYSGGQYDMDWRRPSKADVSDLTANQVLVGGANGEIAQSSALTFTDDGATSTLTTTGADNAEVDISSTSISTLSLYVDPLDFHLVNSGASFFLIDQTSNKAPFHYNGSNFRVGINTTGSTVDFHVVADTVRFEGLDGTGSRLAIDDDGNITRTAAENLAAGTYTPTAANVSNCATFGTVYGHYMSYGNMVWINIKVDINATSSSTLTTASFTLPAGLTSDFTASQDVIGNMSWITTINGSGGAGRVYADATSDLIYVEYRPSNTITFEVNITASYVIQ